MNEDVKCNAEAKDFATGHAYRCDFHGTKIKHRDTVCFQRVGDGVVWWPNGRPDIKEVTR